MENVQHIAVQNIEYQKLLLVAGSAEGVSDWYKFDKICWRFKKRL